MEQILRTGDVLTIAKGCKHTVIAESKLELVEVQMGKISVDDKEKFTLDTYL